MPFFRRRPIEVRNAVRGLKRAAKMYGKKSEPEARAVLVTGAARLVKLDKLNERARALRKKIREVNEKGKDVSAMNQKLEVINRRQMHEVKSLDMHRLANLTPDQRATIKKIISRAKSGTIRDEERRDKGRLGSFPGVGRKR